MPVNVIGEECILLHCKKKKKITAADPVDKILSSSASLSDAASTSNVSASFPPADDAAAALDACRRNELGMETYFAVYYIVKKKRKLPLPIQPPNMFLLQHLCQILHRPLTYRYHLYR